jgi:hypothetical protein
MFDPFKQAKLQSAYSKLKDTVVAEKDMTLDELKRLSGSGQVTGEYSYTPLHELAQKKQQYMRENNIKPGDQAWFHLWFSRPEITKANPFKPRN